MDRRELMLISAAGLILVALALAAPAELLAGNGAASQKIDPALAERLVSGNDEKIPVILILKGEGSPELNDFDVKYRYRLIHGVAGGATPSAIKRIAESDSVQGVFLDGSANLDYPENSSSSSDYISPPQEINADKLWEKGIDGKGVVVAVLDSGIDKNHPDLVDKVIGEKNFVDDEATADDLLGHGTMVAGIIAGSGAASSGKYKGIAPGASLLNVKVINSKGDGRVSDIIAGIEWALYNGADVLSLSLGGINLGETNPPITMAADNAADAGAVVFVAAGNRNSTKLEGQMEKSTTKTASAEPLVNVSQLGDSKNKDVLFLLVPIVLALPPGLIDSPGDGVKVITLGASDSNGHVAGFSGSGPTRDDRIKPDVVAPGVDIVSTVPAGLEKPDYIDVYYARESGTSLSTPVAAGLAALLLQEKANLTPAGIKAVMARGAEKLNNTLGEEYEEYYQGAGLLDALQSHRLLGEDISGVIPDKWIAGRWAYLPAGKGLYVGLDAGADRPQKKLYALAPGDEDWTTRFVFFTNQERKDLKTTVSGSVSDWISLQALPASLPANAQKVFGASITVPKGTTPGIYNGSIEISEGDKKILTIPVSVEVAEPINIIRGTGAKFATLKGSEWDYYYLDVPPGTTDLEASLGWRQSSDLDLFLLAPTSEYYAGEQKGLTEKKNVENPPSGRWLLAVHSENSAVPVNYTLDVERSLVETFPKRWNVESAAPGTSARAQFVVENRGQALENLSYAGVIENITTQELTGSVGYKKVWEKTINVTEKTRRLSAKLSSKDKSNQSEILFVFENPEGEPADAALGSGDLGPLEVSKPESGRWKVKVYGYNVPDTGQSFGVKLLEYAQEPWTWVESHGPTRIDSDSNGTVEANLTIPKNASVPMLDGFIEIASANQTFQIPVSVAVSGTSLEGLTSANVEDRNQDGYYDRLSLGFGVNITAPGEYRLEGELTDCEGNRIEMLSSSASLLESGVINVSLNGGEIWKKGKCGPLRVQNLILYNQRGDLVDRYEKSIAVERDPKQFQPPAAYLTGSFVNRTMTSKIGVGVNLSVIKPGDYQVSGTIVDDGGEELGKDAVESKLLPGNATLVLEFNPTKFMMFGKSSRVHLVDLVLSLDGAELERRDEAWSSGKMSPEGFKPGLRTASANSIGNSSSNSGMTGTLRRENGKMVIS